MTTEHRRGDAAPAERHRRDSEADTRALLVLAGELSAAATESEVARALVGRLAPLLGAVGGALGLVHDDELVIVDAGGVPEATLVANLRLPLSARAPITRAAATGEPVYAQTKEEFRRDFPDGAGLAEYAEGALAVPLVAGDRIVGAIGFPFDVPDRIHSDVVALALLAAALGGQALERAQLYDRERSLRTGLDRIARLPPRFAGRSSDEILSSLCREARMALDADTALLWRLDGSELTLEHCDPPDEMSIGLRVARGTIAALEQSLEHLAPSFTEVSADERESAAGASPLPAGKLALHLPVVSAGAAGGVLTLVFERELSSSRQEALVLARRLADHAQLALEHGAREHAQAAADRSALETRRLLDVTTALAAATTPELVGAAALEAAATTLGAAAGVLVRRDGDDLVVVATSGFTEDEVEAWQRFPATADVPIASAVQRSEIVVFESRDDLARAHPALAERTRHGAWLALPLTAGGQVHGALGLTFAQSRPFGDADLAYIASLARQAAQALDRTILFDEERRARERAERLASDLARLHAFAVSLGAATSTSEVGTLVCEQVKAMLGASACAVYVPNGTELMELLHGASDDEESDGKPYWPETLEIALHPLESLWLERDEDWVENDRYESLRAHGAPAAVLPLAVTGRPTGTLVAWFPEDSYPQESARRLLETMVRQATQPLDRLRLLESERQARLEAQISALRTRTLREVADLLNVAVTPADVAEVLVSVLQSPLAADGVEVFSIDEAEERAELLASSKPAGDRTIPLDALGLYGGRAGSEPAEPEGRTSISVPLPSGIRTPGAVRLTYDAPIVLDEESEAMIQAIARQAGPAIDRSRLYENELLARTRTELLQRLTAAFSVALTLDEVANTFVSDTFRALEADGLYLGAVDSEGRALRTLAWHGYPETVEDLLSSGLPAPGPTAATVASGTPSYYTRIEELWPDHPSFASAFDQLGQQRFAFLPVRSGSTTLGVALVTWSEPFRFDEDLRAFLEAVAAQCGLALDRAARYEAERSVAETLQRAVLPESIPIMEGARVAARYLPGTSALDVGGDWYDTLTLSDGRLGFVVGDVVGKGLRAAATMAQLRNGLRALMLDDADVARTMSKLNRLLEGMSETPFATVAFLAVEPSTAKTCLVSAGHLPPLVIAPDGSARYLEEGRNLPLGVDPELEYHAALADVDPGSFVVLYTDGLVERADESIDDGLARLASVTPPSPRDPELFADAILSQLLGDRPLADDIALLVIELTGTTARPLDITLPAERGSLDRMRAELADWLDDAHVPDAEAKDVLLAVWEAAANGIEHARDDETGTIGIVAAIVGGRVRVEVTDTGRWKDAVPRENRGLGLRMIRAVMTDVEITRTPVGTRVEMERSVSMRAAGDGGDDADAVDDS
ncbi:MAG: GAF domain-containing protein [Actinobacteria bacterium]|nr:GAF domain-containing protein [Actinomycetota bacterium]